MSYEEILKKAESDEPIYLSPKAKKEILSLRYDLVENTNNLFMRLFDQMSELVECILIGGELDEEKGKDIIMTVKNYKDLLSSLLEDDPNREKKI